MIDSLMIFQTHIVDVPDLSGPFKIKMRGPDILVLIPPLLDQRLPQLCIASLDNEHVLVKTDSISPLPGLHVEIFLPFFSLFFLFLEIVVILLILGLFFGGRARTASITLR